jgi:hypothetical protein
MALILRRAGDLQAQREDGRHTLADIQEIARQVGIDPALVTHAAAGLPRKPAPESTTALVRTVEASLPERVTPEDIGRILDAVRRASGAQGAASQVLDTVEWRWGSDRELIDLRVTITPGGNRTNVRVQYDAIGASFLSGFVATIPAILGVMGAASSLPTAAATAVSAGVVVAAGAGLLAARRWLVRHGTSLVDRVSRAIQDEASNPDDRR